MNEQGEIPCLVCGERFEFLHPNHHGRHPVEYPNNHTEYLAWVAERFDIDESDVPLGPSEWRERRELFLDWQPAISISRTN
jgi:hypothetical protein